MWNFRKDITAIYNPVGGINPCVEIEGENRPRGVISELSTGGMSFWLDLKEPGDELDTDRKHFFIRLNINGDTVMMEAELIWSITGGDEAGRVQSVGVRFALISNEDRLKLNEIIEKLRTYSVAGSRRSGG